jgi:hypothetical protein
MPTQDFTNRISIADALTPFFGFSAAHTETSLCTDLISTDFIFSTIEIGNWVSGRQPIRNSLQTLNKSLTPYGVSRSNSRIYANH